MWWGAGTLEIMNNTMNVSGDYERDYERNARTHRPTLACTCTCARVHACAFARARVRGVNVRVRGHACAVCTCARALARVSGVCVRVCVREHVRLACVRGWVGVGECVYVRAWVRAPAPVWGQAGETLKACARWRGVCRHLRADRLAAAD